MKIQVISGSTRPGRNGEAVAKWVHEFASKRDDVIFELVDIKDYKLPPLDEPYPPMMGKYTKEHTKSWSKKISEADGYIFVTAEYNHNIPGSFKNAVDFLNHEWANKSIGFVSYGSNGGSRAVEAWRLVSAELHMADIREQLLLYLGSDFEDMSVFKPKESHESQLNKVIDEVASWAKAMKTIRD